jgi:hypothetical protein
MLFVVKKQELASALSIVRDDRGMRNARRSAPFLRLEARREYLVLQGSEASAEIPATVYETGVLFLRVKLVRQLLPTVEGAEYLEIQVTPDEVLLDQVRLSLAAEDMLLFSDPSTAPPCHPADIPSSEVVRPTRRQTELWDRVGQPGSPPSPTGVRAKFIELVVAATRRATITPGRIGQMQYSPPFLRLRPTEFRHALALESDDRRISYAMDYYNRGGPQNVNPRYARKLLYHDLVFVPRPESRRVICALHEGHFSRRESNSYMLAWSDFAKLLGESQAEGRCLILVGAPSTPELLSHALTCFTHAKNSRLDQGVAEELAGWFELILIGPANSRDRDGLRLWRDARDLSAQQVRHRDLRFSIDYLQELDISLGSNQ